MVKHEQNLGKYYLKKHYSLFSFQVSCLFKCLSLLRCSSLVASAAFSSGFQNSRCKSHFLRSTDELLAFSLQAGLYLMNFVRILYVYTHYIKLLVTTYRKLCRHLTPAFSYSSAIWVHRTSLLWMSVKT